MIKFLKEFFILFFALAIGSSPLVIGYIQDPKLVNSNILFHLAWLVPVAALLATILRTILPKEHSKAVRIIAACIVIFIFILMIYRV